MSAPTSNHLQRSDIMFNTCRYVYSESLQVLWSGYGEIARYTSESKDSIIVKHVTPPETIQHPRGWNTPLSHKRKLRSYQVEALFYQHYSQQCDDDCRVPGYLQEYSPTDENRILLEDLDAAGYSVRHTNGDYYRVALCLTWLANFHAQFLATQTPELWPQSGYWHLHTRPDELQNMADSPLKQAAADIDEKLHSCSYQTLNHGDAKLANFCFHKEEKIVAALDFQYAGRGPGIKDVVLLLASSFDNSALEEHANELVQEYFRQLRMKLNAKIPAVDIAALCRQWADLVPFAWADYQRFLEGWKPGHSRITPYMQRHTDSVL
ncbi:phosphotransferase [Planctobacterium marinum]|uniref:Phosphotransferase n=1 Tax=Planctobacterium marinum TaxID=1631968 RepID=A0AA48I9K3_9ALTE|nr:phosphotransferase [Planctobacterium marinum]